MSLVRHGHGLPIGFPGYMQPSFLDVPDISSASWLVDPYSGRCCEFCDAMEAIPDLEIILEELSFYDPHHYATMSRLHDSVHGHYMLGYDRDGSESYHLSRKMERLSELLQMAQRRNPRGGRGLGDFASRVKYMSRDVMMGPRRHRFDTFAMPRYPDGSYYWGERWDRRRGWRY
ncbi:hypothetical protein BDU57DRAFT_2884 [Ampelomyces quisqualis]|uniref:Uncharacterized protein n=1 Tax=Ampelomyces quisqualis TaxID=50730 RepID=A0A6A5QZ03_AMPQU|nr:hypothetical protein BDU57DRAFT_2884 [Ampelomyces quisqualis]